MVRLVPLPPPPKKKKKLLSFIGFRMGVGLGVRVRVVDGPEQLICKPQTQAGGYLNSKGIELLNPSVSMCSYGNYVSTWTLQP